MISPLDFEAIFIEPWKGQAVAVDSAWIVLMGFLVTLGCGLIGHFLVVRRMALVGDAISHSVLPGIVIAFMMTGVFAMPAFFIGAAAAGLLATLLIEGIHRASRVKPDAALGIVFSTFFAIGVVLITLFAGHVDLDVDCVLYGEIGLIPWEPRVAIGNFALPESLMKMLVVTLLNMILLAIFYKELLVMSFDPGLARAQGIRTGLFHYGMMALLSITIVSAFTAVGAILVIAMLIFPAATASLLFQRMPALLLSTPVFAALYSFGGFHLAVWLNSAIAGAMVLVACAIFGLVWILAPEGGLLATLLKQSRSTEREVNPAPDLKDVGSSGR